MLTMLLVILHWNCLSSCNWFFLWDHCPLPSLALFWNTHCHYQAKQWPTSYIGRMQRYTNLSRLKIKFEVIELKTDDDVLKVLVQSNYWKRFGPIEILVVFSKPVIKMEDDMSRSQLVLANCSLWCILCLSQLCCKLMQCLNWCPLANETTCLLFSKYLFMS